MATGRKAESDWVHVFTIRNGQVVKFQEYFDTAVAVAAHQKAVARQPEAVTA
jgi:uncharacterized protein